MKDDDKDDDWLVTKIVIFLVIMLPIIWFIAVPIWLRDFHLIKEYWGW